MRPPHDRLAEAHVHVGGAGRIGTAVVLALHAAGVGRISCNDPQLFEEEQLHVQSFARRSDLGRPKVFVLERFLDARPNLVFEPIHARNESPRVGPYLKNAQLIVSCANRIDARLHLERAAVRLNKPCIQASAQDAREGLSGLISVWMPGIRCSCFGCLLPEPRPKFRRDEILLPTVTSTIANFTAHLAVRLLMAGPKPPSRPHNVFSFDLGAYALESISVAPRRECSICGTTRLVGG